MGSRGQKSTSANSNSSNERLEIEIKILESKIFSRPATDAKEDLKKQIDVARKLDGTLTGVELHGGRDSWKLFKIAQAMDRPNYVMSYNFKLWAEGRERPLGAKKEVFDEGVSFVKDLRKKYDDVTLAAAYNFAHTFKDEWDLGLK